MKTKFFCLLLCLAMLGVARTASALIITRTSDALILIDASSSVSCTYASYQIINNDGVNYSNLWVKIDSFSGPKISLGGGDPGQYNLGKLSINQTNTVFFYLQATNTTTSAETHSVKVYRGTPSSGVLLTSQTFSLTVSSSGQNSSQTITGASVAPNPATVGGLFIVTITGQTGTIGGSNTVNFTPAVYTSWDASSYQLVGCQVVLSGGNTGTYTNTLVTSLANKVNTTYTNTFWFRALAVGPTNSVSPLSIQTSGGGNYTHAPPPAAGVISVINPATNMTLVNASGAAQVYTNEVLTLSVGVTNSSTNTISLDTVVDTLPPGFSYVSNSAAFNGTAISDPAISGQALTWSDGYAVPGGMKLNLTFQVVPTAPGYATNQVVAYCQNTLIDTTLNTADSAPATNIVRVLLAPTAVDDTNTAFENTTLAVAAPGVLGNDIEPNGFALSVIGYTQPAHGNLTLSANGAYSYTPANNYYGPDSFTYTLTNGNAGASTATVNLVVLFADQPPTLGPLSNVTMNENGSLQTVNLSGISAGPANESSQNLTVTAFSSNPALIPDPTVSYVNPNSTGSIQFQPVANSYGTATISVVVTDDGETTNGGINSVTNTFTVTVNAINQPPTLNPLSNLTINENAERQTVNLSGISAGPASESSQTLTVTAISSNPAVVPNPTVNYTSPNSIGSILLAPATNAFGTTTISVVVTDSGGTGNGGVNSVTNTFTVTVNAVNQPPTLNPLTDLAINEDAGQQTVNLSGISSGPANEPEQGLTVTAISSNPALIPNPTVNYTSPNATGSLQFTPATNGFGTASISVVVADSGGTANGGVNALTNTFTVTVNGVTNVWNAGGAETNNINDALGLPGTGYDCLNLTGVLDIEATTNNPFTIHLVSSNGVSTGLASNFNYTNSYAWTIATTTRGITGFDPGKFVVDDSQFSNDLAGGVFSITESADSNSVAVVFTPNHAPVANAAGYDRAWGTLLRISASDLLARFTSDADGDGRALVQIGASTNGSWLSTNGSSILYAPTNNLTENFCYIVRDTRVYRPGDTVLMATNWITVNVTNAVGQVQSLQLNGGSVNVNFSGVPGYGYDVERSTDLVTWTVVMTTNAPANGMWIFQDPNPPPNQGYYRLKQH